MKSILVVFVLSAFLVSCSITKNVSEKDQTDYYKNVLKGWGETYLIAVPVILNDSVKYIVTFRSELESYFCNCLKSCNYMKNRKQIYKSMKNQTGLEVTDALNYYSISWLIPSQKVDSIYRLGFDYFVQYYLDTEQNMLNKDSIKNYSADELNYLYSIFIKHKFYVFAIGYGEFEIYKDYHPELTN